MKSGSVMAEITQVARQAWAGAMGSSKAALEKYFCCSDGAPKYSPLPALSLHPPKMIKNRLLGGKTNQTLLLKGTASETELTHTC